MNEIWRDINGFEGLYQVSNFGNVKSLNYMHTGEEKTLKCTIGDRGYYQLTLRKDNKRYNKLVHRLVLEAFIPNPNKLECVNHINGIKTDNRVENLEWASCKENNIHAIKTGLRNVSKFRCIETGFIYDSYEEIMNELKIKSSSQIYRSIKNNYKIKGCRFERI